MGCVGKVAREPPRCTFMTLLARGHNILMAKMRLRISNGKNIMSAMAIVALRGLRVAQLGDFAVICIEVGLCDVLVTPPAFRHDVQFESGFVGAADRVGTMTITADGKRLVSLPYFDVMNTLLKLFLDAVMASSARCRNILRIDA